MSERSGNLDAPVRKPDTAAYVARQPICDRELQTIGYELLFRDSLRNTATIHDGKKSTIETIVNSFMEIGLKRLVGDRVAFINVTRDFIITGGCRILPKERVVLEVLEDDVPDEDMINGLGDLAAHGYKIALDDFVCFEAVRPLLNVCHIIKIDARQVDRATLEKEIPLLRQSQPKLLAEKVETYEEFDYYRNLGCDYFQGYFFCRPTMYTARKTPLNRAAILRLLGKLQTSDVGADEIEDIFIQDLSLSYRLLRYVNSAFVALPHKVQSISQAAQLVGIERLRTWATLMLVAGFDGKPPELVSTSMIRARMCELLAGELGESNRDLFFTVGLFSALDAFLDCPMEEALRELPLSPVVYEALLNRKGLAGELLQLVVEYERGAIGYSESFSLGPNTLQSAFLNSIDWTDQLLTKR